MFVMDARDKENVCYVYEVNVLVDDEKKYIRRKNKDIASTIVDVTSNDVKVLREGPISLDKIMEVIHG